MTGRIYTIDEVMHDLEVELTLNGGTTYPEEFVDYVRREYPHGLPSDWDPESKRMYLDSTRPYWRRNEERKAELSRLKARKHQIAEEARREDEKREREREKQRREIQTKLEREQREAERKREREAERERRDPTPDVLPASTIPEIPFEIRDQHIFVPGMTRHGKSSQLFHLIMDDITHDRGVAVLDPIKGHLVTQLLAHIPERRHKDCIYLDLKNPIPLDVMRPTPNPENLVGDIKELVLKGDTTLKRAEPILTRLVYALLSMPGSKFTDIEDIFTLPKRKQWFLDNLEKTDERRYEYWKNNWPSGKDFEPLFNRMTDFTENPSLRIILGNPNPVLNLRTAMDERKIILVSLPGESEVTQIYGTMLVSRFQQAAYSRADVPKSELQPFCLYVDEFEMFQTQSFNKILQAAGGLGLYLTLGNQHVFQLTDDIRHSVFGNVGTCIIFKVREGFDLFSTIIHPYKTHHLGLIPRHQAIFKIGDNPPEFHWTKKPPDFTKELEQRAEEVRQKLIRQTIDKYRPTNAESGTIRAGDNAALHSPAVRHHEEDDSTNPRSENIEPSGPPRT